MAGDKHQTKQVISDVIIIRDAEISHGHVLLCLKLATQFFMLSLEELVAPKVIDSPVLRGGHQPSAGIIRNARLRPPLQSSNESILRELFRHTDVANDASQAGDQPGRLDPPHGVDGAMGVGSRHGHPSDHLQIVRASQRSAVNSWPLLSCLSKEPLLWFGLIYLAKLTFTITDHLEEILQQLDCLLLGVRPEDGEAQHHLFGLGERSIRDAYLSVSGANARAERAWQAALCGNQPTGLHPLFD